MRTMRTMRTKLGIALVGVLLAAQTFALSTDREQPINIEADQAEADDNLGVTIYKGDVVIVQGSMRILGDTVTIYFDDGQDITKVVAIGKPAKFRQQPDGEADFQNAEAETLEFYTDEDTIVMLGSAHSWQGANAIKAERIVYDTKAGKVKADSAQSIAGGSGDGETGSRVSITIAPKKKKETQE